MRAPIAAAVQAARLNAAKNEAIAHDLETEAGAATGERSRDLHERAAMHQRISDLALEHAAALERTEERRNRDS